MNDNILITNTQTNNTDKCKFNLDSIPSNILLQISTEKSDFDLTTVPEYERTFTLCYLAISYNPRRNLIHTPLHVFEVDRTLSFYLTFKRFFDEVPSEVEQVVVINHFERLLDVDDQLLVKYIDQIKYSVSTYDYLLNIGKITYKQIPESELIKVLESFTKYDHRYLIIKNKLSFEEVPVYIRLPVYSDKFIINLIEQCSYKLTDFPSTFISDHVLKHFIEAGKLSETDSRNELRNQLSTLNFKQTIYK